ncbi:MAG: hypothetical protein II998_04920 [Clostridia bacterium]|nr:hypothetical protein [Clostridia bacterium]
MSFIEKGYKLLIRKKTLPILICVLCLGIFLAISSSKNLFSFETKDNALMNNEYAQKSESETLPDNYNSNIEKELETILSYIKGVGEVKVEIIFKSGYEKVALKIRDENGNETTVSENNGSSTKPFITKENAPAIEGVIIVAEFNGNIEIRNEMTESVSSVLNVPIHKVKIFEMK